MPQLTIYQKPTCSTCRTVMALLRDAGVEYDAINYIVTPPSRATLAGLLRKMGATARDLLRTREPEYRELGLDDPSAGDDRILDAMVEHPVLIQRPILEYGPHAMLARPAERVGDALREWGIDARTY